MFKPTSCTVAPFKKRHVSIQIHKKSTILRNLPERTIDVQVLHSIHMTAT
jgi:hypothetical protein